MKIIFSLLTGERVSIESDLSATVGSFVDHLKHEFHLYNENIKLIFFGEALNETHTLKQINYFDGGIIFIETSGPINQQQTQQNQNQNGVPQRNQQNQGNNNNQNQQTDDNDEEARDRRDRFRELTSNLFSMLTGTFPRPDGSNQSKTQEILMKNLNKTSGFPCNVQLTEEQKKERAQMIGEKAVLNEAFSVDRDKILFLLAQALPEEVRSKIVLNNDLLNTLLSHDLSDPVDADSMPDIMHELIDRGLDIDQANKVYNICRGNREACLVFVDAMRDTISRQRNRNANIFSFFFPFLGHHSSESTSSSSDDSDDFQVYHTAPEDFQVD